jgi:molybdopterin molybdotransferase
MLTVEQALEAILAKIEPLPAVRTPLLQARGRVLAEDILADIDNPPFDNSAVDGYAVRAADTEGASPEHPVVLRELAEVPAGAVARAAIKPGTCIRVMTGAPIPDGADAMVMIEDTRRRGDTEKRGDVEICRPARCGDHIRRAGEDVRAGTRVLKAGTIVGAAETAMLAAMGCPKPLCIRRPRVAVLSTGDELVEISEKPGPGQIRDSNRHALAALVAEAGAELHSAQHLPDDEAATEASLRACAGPAIQNPKSKIQNKLADVIVTSGGVSVGDRDYVKPVLESIGTLELWKVKMKPGKPVAFGHIGSALFFGLPGNPVSTMVTFELFVRPALWKLAGRTDLERPRVNAALTADVRHKPGRREYVRAVVRLREGVFHAEPTGAQGSGILSSMLGANALLVLHEETESLRAGDSVEALLLDARL